MKSERSFQVVILRSNQRQRIQLPDATWTLLLRRFAGEGLNRGNGHPRCGTTIGRINGPIKIKVATPAGKNRTRFGKSYIPQPMAVGALLFGIGCRYRATLYKIRAGAVSFSGPCRISPRKRHYHWHSGPGRYGAGRIITADDHFFGL